MIGCVTFSISFLVGVAIVLGIFSVIGIGNVSISCIVFVIVLGIIVVSECNALVAIVIVIAAATVSIIAWCFPFSCCSGFVWEGCKFPVSWISSAG